MAWKMNACDEQTPKCQEGLRGLRKQPKEMSRAGRGDFHHGVAHACPGGLCLLRSGRHPINKYLSQILSATPQRSGSGLGSTLCHDCPMLGSPSRLTPPEQCFQHLLCWISKHTAPLEGPRGWLAAGPPSQRCASPPRSGLLTESQPSQGPAQVPAPSLSFPIPELPTNPSAQRPPWPSGSVPPCPPHCTGL